MEDQKTERMSLEHTWGLGFETEGIYERIYPIMQKEAYVMCYLFRIGLKVWAITNICFQQASERDQAYGSWLDLLLMPDICTTSTAKSHQAHLPFLFLFNLVWFGGHNGWCSSWQCLGYLWVPGNQTQFSCMQACTQSFESSLLPSLFPKDAQHGYQPLRTQQIWLWQGWLICYHMQPLKCRLFNRVALEKRAEWKKSEWGNPESKSTCWDQKKMCSFFFLSDLCKLEGWQRGEVALPTYAGIDPRNSGCGNLWLFHISLLIFVLSPRYPSLIHHSP